MKPGRIVGAVKATQLRESSAAKSLREINLSAALQHRPTCEIPVLSYRRGGQSLWIDGTAITPNARAARILARTISVVLRNKPENMCSIAEVVPALAVRWIRSKADRVGVAVGS